MEEKLKEKVLAGSPYTMSMTRKEWFALEAMKTIFWQDAIDWPLERCAERAFDIAEVMEAEALKRRGAK
jgi:hypothetical protein